MSKVFHAIEKTHDLVRSHCQANGLVVKVWVDQVIRAALQREGVDLGTIEKKRRLTSLQDDGETSVYDQPPFWEKREAAVDQQTTKAD